MQAIQPIAYLQAKFARQHCQVMLQSLMRWFSAGNSLSRLDQAFDDLAFEISRGRLHGLPVQTHLRFLSDSLCVRRDEGVERGLGRGDETRHGHLICCI